MAFDRARTRDIFSSRSGESITSLCIAKVAISEFPFIWSGIEQTTATKLGELEQSKM